MDALLNYLIIAGKSVTIYIFIIVAIRIFGKKELSQLSVIDLVFILLISNSVQNAMVGSDTSVTGGIAAALGLFITNYIFKIFLRGSVKFNKIIQGEKIVIVVDGKVLQKGLKESMMSIEEIEMAVREHGVSSIEEANLVVLEVDGNVTVLSSDYSHKTVKKIRKPQLSHNP
jgi:uncharacterized membrane protein YcaP (DUF421 family)